MKEYNCTVVKFILQFENERKYCNNSYNIFFVIDSMECNYMRYYYIQIENKRKWMKDILFSS